ncbi:hypothetical protein AB5J56_44935 [Streptomyces sp. R21]|uniref:Uncharacterized protein n=1 Tax=Streptomyces sp. R21 TaxID=3238627 RepID=A0AB39PLF7_9ACTN
MVTDGDRSDQFDIIDALVHLADIAVTRTLPAATDPAPPAQASAWAAGTAPEPGRMALIHETATRAAMVGQDRKRQVTRSRK